MADGFNSDQTTPLPVTGINSTGVLPSPLFQGGQTPGSVADLVGMVSQLQNLPMYQQPSQQLSQIGERERGVESQLAEMSKPENMPKTHWQPKYEPVTGAGSLLRDVGKGILQALSFTGPGQTIQNRIYEPGVDQYRAKQHGLVEQLAALRGEEQIPTEQMRAATGMTGAASLGAYRQGMLGVRNRMADTAAQRATNQYVIEGQKLQQGWDRLGQGEQKIKIQQWYDQGVLQAMNSRISAGEDENQARINAQEDMRSALSQNQWAMQHPILNALGMQPDIQAAPGAQPTKPAKSADQAPPNKPPKSAGGKNVAAGTIVYDPQGRAHRADGTAPLPPNWSLKKK